MLTKGDKIIAGTGTITPLLTSIWSDHILNDISWLRADTYSWQSGDVYVAAYEHLAAEVNENPLEHDIINGINIPFHRANDGHKIVVYNHTVPERDQLLTNLLNSSGSAWYYLLDTENRRFKLPRTKFGFTGLRTGVGDYVEPGVPNITGTFIRVSYSRGAGGGGASEVSGCFTSTVGNSGCDGGAGANDRGTVTMDASRSSSVYGKSNTVQPAATQMYLYFYVGQFTQTAIEQTAGITTEVMGTKVDKGHEVVEYWRDGVNYYRVYADGFCEQYIFKVLGSTTIAAHTGIDITNKGLNLYKPMDVMRGVACASGNSCVIAGDPFYNTNTTVGLWIYNASGASITSDLRVGIWLQGRVAK